MTVEVGLLGPRDVEAVAPEVVEVYREAFGGPPYWEDEESVWRFAHEVLPHHAERRDFRLALARQRGEVVGFGYGYTGEPGQWWHDWVRAELGPARAAEWGGAFELVELAVRPADQGRGIGGRLHDALLAGLRQSAAVLSTLDADTPARELYRRRGWVTLLEGLGRPPRLVMGLRLAGSARAHPG
jgi:ribosomal protein S18 acetylase RimI-like enzyme